MYSQEQINSAVKQALEHQANLMSMLNEDAQLFQELITSNVENTTLEQVLDLIVDVGTINRLGIFSEDVALSGRFNDYVALPFEKQDKSIVYDAISVPEGVDKTTLTVTSYLIGETYALIILGGGE